VERKREDDANPADTSKPQNEQLSGRNEGTDKPPGAQGTPGRNHPWYTPVGGERGGADTGRQTDAVSRGDLQQQPEAVARNRSAELQAALKSDQRGRVTMASGVLESSDGQRQLVSGTSEHLRSGRPYVRPEVAEAMGPRAETVARGTGHAEQNIVSHARENGMKVVSVGAGRPVCGDCVKAIEGAGGTVASPKKREEQGG